MGVISLSVIVVMFGLAFAQTNQPNSKSNIQHGKSVFNDNCSECHDSESKEEKIGPGLQGLSLGKLPDGRKATHDQLLDIINTGPAEMPSFKDQLSEQEKEDLVAFLLTL